MSEWESRVQKQQEIKKPDSEAYLGKWGRFCSDCLLNVIICHNIKKNNRFDPFLYSVGKSTKSAARGFRVIHHFDMCEYKS